MPHVMGVIETEKEALFVVITGNSWRILQDEDKLVAMLDRKMVVFKVSHQQ